MDKTIDEQFIAAFTEAQVAIRSFCFASVGDPEDAKDVFQKTCLVLWKKSGDWDPETSFLRWAITVARFEILAHVRAAARDRLVFDEETVLAMTGASERLIDGHTERIDALEECLKQVSTEKRDLLSDFYVFGYTAKEISQRRKKGVSATKVTLMRGRKLLAECIEKKLLAT